MKGLPQVIKVEVVNLYLWQQRRFSRLLQEQYRKTNLLEKSRESTSVFSEKIKGWEAHVSK